MYRVTVTSLLLTVGLATALVAQDVREQRLSLATPGTRSVAPGAPFTLTFVHGLPGVIEQGRYVLSVQRRSIAISELEPPPGVTGGTKPPCVEDALDDLGEAASEGELPLVIDRLVETHHSDCGNLPVIEFTAELREATTFRDGGSAYTLSRGEELAIRVERPGAEPIRFTLTTGARGAWRTHYGFTFFLDRDDTFFSDPVEGAEGRFAITKEEDRSDLGFAPSVLFSWLPASRRGRSLAWGPVAGLGVDTESPIVFGGVGLTYNENVMLSAGVIVHKQRRLDGRYSVGDTIMENLDDDQLTRGNFSPNLYFGLAYRFSSSPFGGSGGEEESDADDQNEVSPTADATGGP